MRKERTLQRKTQYTFSGPPFFNLQTQSYTIDVSIGELFLGGFGPGILYGLSMVVLSYFICRKYGWGGEGTFSIKNIVTSFVKSIWALLLPVIILGGIYGRIFTPTEAAAVSSVYALLIGLFVYKELKVKDIPKIVATAIYGTVVIMFIVAAAKVFGYVITSAQIPHKLGLFMTAIAPNKVVFLILVNVILLLMGMLVNPSAAVVILTPILLPTALNFRIDPVFFGVLMICNLAIGNITPPVGLDLFVVSAVTKLSIDRIARAIYPYILVLVAQVFLFALFPQIIMFLPNLFK